MQNVKGIEAKILNFLDWYPSFLTELKGLKLPETGGEGAEVINENPKIFTTELSGSYGISYLDWGSYQRVTDEQLLAKEAELSASVTEICGSDATPYFNFLGMIGIQQVDLFLTAIEFPIGERQKLAARFLVPDISGPTQPYHRIKSTAGILFSPSPIIPAHNRDPSYDSRHWRSWTHEEGEDQGHLSFELGSNSGRYFVGGQSVFSIRVDSISCRIDGNYKNKYISVRELPFSKQTKPGALTSFLEMLEERPIRN
ncbi:hypothetical protein CL619_00890 [archaeon]|nr:hypothetical protein [archaeon]|tara:strand:+ start:6820 stop:7587 length:768 start_codon:yes stop_codon:yes gene_type:complete